MRVPGVGRGRGRGGSAREVLDAGCTTTVVPAHCDLLPRVVKTCNSSLSWEAKQEATHQPNLSRHA